MDSSIHLYRDRPKSLMILVSAGIDLESKDNNGRTALIYASANNNVRLVKFLIENGADVNARSNEGEDALIKASSSYRGSKEIVELLIKHGADVNARSNEGEDALVKASSRGSEEIVELLVKHGADVNTTDRYGGTALSWAVMCSSIKMTEILIRKGADVFKSNVSALVHASRRNSTKIVQILIDATKGMKDIEFEYGKALTSAIKGGQADNARLLIAHNAYLNDCHSGGTPLNRAKRQGMKDIIELLEEAGAEDRYTYHYWLYE